MISASLFGTERAWGARPAAVTRQVLQIGSSLKTNSAWCLGVLVVSLLSMRSWPAEGVTRVPFWVYSDPDIYAREQERIFAGPSWCYVGLTAEIPNPGDFKRSFVGDKPGVVCRTDFGTAKEFMCPYHQWTYDLRGNLKAVPLRAGLRGQGGMPKDFRLADHGLQRLGVSERPRVVFAA